jgi:hypothetical protein
MGANAISGGGDRLPGIASLSYSLSSFGGGAEERWSYRKEIVFCKIWGFHGGDYEAWCLLGCYAVWFL